MERVDSSSPIEKKPPSLADVRVLIQQSRRQLIYGPSPNYNGPRPSIACELYLTNLPLNLDVQYLFQWLNRLGTVFEMRVMMVSATETRGYSFVRFFDEKAARAAFELLSFLILDCKRPNVQISKCKRQLFVGGIPKHLPINDVRAAFQRLFGHKLTKCVVYPQILTVNGEKNRGFAFLSFLEHDAALSAKRYLRNNCVWGHYTRVDWARPNEENKSLESLHPSAFCRKNDYSAKLRLYALANNWHIPIVVYGSNFKRLGVQYGGILLKDSKTALYSCIVVEVVGMVFDIHILLCEIATQLVEVFCGMPQKHYVIRARQGTTAKILYSFRDVCELVFLKSKQNGLLSDLSAVDLLTSLEFLAKFNAETILKFYKLSFRKDSSASGNVARFALFNHHRLSHFYSIFPKFRHNFPLNNNFNDTEIVLLQEEAVSNDSQMTKEDIDILLNTKAPDEGAFMLKSQRYNRHPEYVLYFVDFDMLKTCAFYHPLQRLNSPPLWLHGKSYQYSIFETSKGDSSHF